MLLVMVGTGVYGEDARHCYVLSASASGCHELADTTKQSGEGKPLAWSTLLAVRYLAAVIHEANRLSFGVTWRTMRHSPTETLTYTASYGPNTRATYVLPSGTRMSTVTLRTPRTSQSPQTRGASVPTAGVGAAKK
ncbi:Uu.00g029550.m01.CDS01 [Anthostomella pinea]|uniref:Uu.00g029550.m01.CDS01 n=1 Tax=Anthostomella pinea TaxID=933095 RepID=A0AAI8YCW9_9PEZI|nr:Uu.00g029550.m01.CDS01 [Anthostomella pinea]